MCGPSASGVAALGLSLPIPLCLQGRWLTLPKCRGRQGEKCPELPSQLPHLEIPSSIYSPNTTCTPCVPSKDAAPRRYLGVVTAPRQPDSMVSCREGTPRGSCHPMGLLSPQHRLPSSVSWLSGCEV